MFTKKYLQDRPILFLNITVVALLLLNIIASILRIDTSKSVSIIRYQVAAGQAGFYRAEPYELFGFAIAAVVFSVLAIFLSTKLYTQQRMMSLLLLSLTIIVLIFNFIVSNAIFNLQ